MMGSKDYQEKLFYGFSLTQRIPEDHLVRQLDRVIDLSFVRPLVAKYYSHTGQPSVDPVVLFKMMLLGYLYGITSERRLAEECSLNMAFMWYVGYDLDEPTPNHSVISKARARYGKEVFERFFQEILSICVRVGLVKGEKVFADSTLIRANASLKSIVSRAEAREVKYTPKEY
ncbi:MAG: transposase, partial [Candidatus Brocadiales bacterium]